MSHRPFALLVAFIFAVAAPVYAIDVAGKATAGLPAAGARVAAGPGLRFNYTPAQIGQNYQAAEARLLKSLEAVLAMPAAQRTFENTVLAYETAGAEFGQDLAEIAVISRVSPDEEAQKAAVEAITKASNLGIGLNARADLYEALQAYVDKKEALDPVKARLLDETMAAFKSGGHGLAPEKKARLNEVQQKLSDLATSFEENVKAD